MAKTLRELMAEKNKTSQLVHPLCLSPRARRLTHLLHDTMFARHIACHERRGRLR